MSWQILNGTIQGVTVTTTGNACSVPVPVTIPGGATSSTGATVLKLGSEQPIYWTTMGGAAKTYTLATPIKL
jgi:hypothetical protein